VNQSLSLVFPPWLSVVLRVSNDRLAIAWDSVVDRESVDGLSELDDEGMTWRSVDERERRRRRR
jgi:hypothetical protein